VRKEARKKQPRMFLLAIVIDGELAGCIGFESIDKHKRNSVSGWARSIGARGS